MASSMSDSITSEVIRRFNDAFQRHDPTALIELVAEDCVIENTNYALIILTGYLAGHDAKESILNKGVNHVQRN